jgi:hypothetical protein
MPMTRPDDSRHPDLYDVNDAQLAAVSNLVAGATTTQAAEAAGVSRQTVSLWRNHHAGFIAELNRQRSELNQERVDRVRDIDTHALDLIAIAMAIDGQADVDVAIKWATMRRLATVDVTQIGPTDAVDIVDRKAAAIQSCANRETQLEELMGSFDGGVTKAAAFVHAEEQLAAALTDARTRRFPPWLLAFTGHSYRLGPVTSGAVGPVPIDVDGYRMDRHQS